MALLNEMTNYPPGKNLMIKIINGDSRRATQLKSQLREICLRFEIVEPILLDSIPLAFDQRPSIAIYGRPLKPGEIGCARSHLRTYSQILSSKQSWAVILEDDARISNIDSLYRFLDFAEEFMISSEPRVVTLFSGAVCYSPTEYADLFSCLNVPSHTVGYAINLKAAQILIEKNREGRFTADWPLGTQIQFYIWKPLAIAHGDHESTSVIGDRLTGTNQEVFTLSNFSWEMLVDRLKRYLFINFFLRDRHFFLSIRDYWIQAIRNRFVWQLGRAFGRRIQGDDLIHYQVSTRQFRFFRWLFPQA